MISTFGPHAKLLRDAIPPDIEVIVFDEMGLTEAFREAVRRRERGERFYGMAIFDEARVAACNAVALDINGRSADREQRHFAARALAEGHFAVDGEVARKLWEGKDAAHCRSFGRVLALADEMLVRSYFEYSRYAAAQEDAQTPGFRRILLADTVPAFEPAQPRRLSVVVWKGRRLTSQATLALIGLEEFRGAVTYVGEYQLTNIGARFIRRDDPALPELLATAGCIVCVDPADPADAVAFARRGMSVVAPTTSGAYEFADGIVSWDAGDATTLYHAVALALGRRPTGASLDAVPTRPPAPASLPADTELPLVSIITATYNRREYLRKMLTCIATQTYPNVESIVVNDAGEPVDDIVADFPFARLLNAGVNGGTLRAFEIGMGAARGAYIGLLPDDDWLYPDHVERLMAAILLSGAAVAHAGGIMRFLRRGPDGTNFTYGFNPATYAATVGPTAALVGTSVAAIQWLQRRDTFEPDDVGWYLNDAVGADQEYFMRLVDRHQLVWLDRLSCEFRDHAENTGKQYNWEAEMRYIYETVQPISRRPLTQQLRQNTLANLRKIAVGENVVKPLFVL